MSAAGGANTTGGDGQPAPSGSRASRLIGGTSKKQNKHLSTFQKWLDGMIGAHPALRVIVGVQSAYSNQIVLIRHHNMPATGQRLSHAFVNACAEEGSRTAAARVRAELAAVATPEMLEFLGKVLDLTTAEGVLAPKQVEMVMNLVTGCSLHAQPGGQAGGWEAGAGWVGGWAGEVCASRKTAMHGMLQFNPCAHTGRAFMPAGPASLGLRVGAWVQGAGTAGAAAAGATGGITAGTAADRTATGRTATGRTAAASGAEGVDSDTDADGGECGLPPTAVSSSRLLLRRYCRCFKLI